MYFAINRSLQAEVQGRPANGHSTYCHRLKCSNRFKYLPFIGMLEVCNPMCNGGLASAISDRIRRAVQG